MPLSLWSQKGYTALVKAVALDRQKRFLKACVQRSTDKQLILYTYGSSHPLLLPSNNSFS